MTRTMRSCSRRRQAMSKTDRDWEVLGIVILCGVAALSVLLGWFAAMITGHG